MTTVVDLPKVDRGDTTPYVFRFFDELGAAIDMRGKTLIMTFKVSPFQLDDEADLTKVVLVPLDQDDALKHIIAFQLEGSETAQLRVGLDYSYAVRIITEAVPENNELTYFSGTVPVGDA